jgi:hypothetical protein
MSIRWKRVLALCAIPVLAACDESTFLYVESDVPFNGTIVGAQTHTFVNQVQDLKWGLGDGIVCWSFSKNTSQGTLHVYLEVDDGPGGPERTFSEITTDSAFVIDGCKNAQD